MEIHMEQSIFGKGVDLQLTPLLALLFATQVIWTGIINA